MTSFDDIKQDPSHPFWDFVNQLDNARNIGNSNNVDSNLPAASDSRNAAYLPWVSGLEGGPSSVPLPHRGRETGHHEEGRSMTPPPPPPPHHPHPPHPPHGHRPASPHRSRSRRGSHHGPHQGPYHGHRGGPHGPRGGRGGPRGGWPWSGSRGQPCGPPPSFGGAAPVDLPGLASWVQDTFINPRFGGGRTSGEEQGDSQDFTPAIDVFSTDAAFLVHASLPGALKQDIAVNWSAESSSLIISGVITRSGVESLVKITGERQVGAFERKIVLWAGDENIKVDEDRISAKLEDGVLRIEVPKVAKNDGFVEVKRVDID